MKIDQRLDELAERQTMLHRSVERLADDQRKAFERRAVVFAECEATLAENQVLLSRIHESIDSAERMRMPASNVSPISETGGSGLMGRNYVLGCRRS